MLIKNEGCLGQIFSENQKTRLKNIVPIIVIVAGAALAIFGVMHFIPQWTHLPRWTVSVSYMTLSQLSLNSFAFSSLIIGTAMVVTMVAKLIQNKVMKFFNKAAKIKEDAVPFNVRTITPHLIIAAIAAAITITSLVLGTHALNNLSTGLLKSPSGVIMAVSQTQLFSIIGFGTYGAAIGGIGLYALARLIYLSVTKPLQNENSKTPKVIPYPNHEI